MPGTGVKVNSMPKNITTFAGADPLEDKANTPEIRALTAEVPNRPEIRVFCRYAGVNYEHLQW